MSPFPRLLPLVCAMCALLALAGCASDTGEPPTPPGEPPKDGSHCAVDQDCPDAALFFCNTATASCEPACRTRDDCGRERRGAYALAMCDDSVLGCQCDMSVCLPAGCAADANCGQDRVCRDGGCVQVSAADDATVRACEVTPALAAGRAGVPVAFQVWARDAEGRPVVPSGAVTWQARSPGAVLVEARGTRATFALGLPGAWQEAVEVRVGGASCRARVTVLPALAVPGEVRVQVVDELTGHPVPDATVVVSSAGGSPLASGVTGDEGAVWVPATGEVGLSVFHTDYGYLTLARHDALGTPDVRLAVRRNPLDRAGGLSGGINLPPTDSRDTSSLRMALSGLSVPGLASELAPGVLLGPEREVELGTGNSLRRLRLPSGSDVWLPGTAPEELRVPGVAGVCDATLAGVDDVQEAVREGACGTRAAWALTGLLSPSELPLTLLGADADPLLLLARRVPRSPRMYSSVERDAQFTLAPTPLLPTGEPDLEAVRYPRAVSHAMEGVRLSFPFTVRVPELPSWEGVHLSRTWVVATVAVPGRGVVPLGLGAAANVAPADAYADAEGLARPGVVPLRMAPAHHGLEGLPYRLVLAADSGPGRGSTSGAGASSMLRVDLPGPTFDPLGLRPVSPGASFLRIPEDSRYNFDAAAYGGLEARQLRADVDEAGSLVRAVFTNRAGRRWTVLADPQHAREGVGVPRPPAGFEDRTYFGDVQGSRARLRVEVLAVSARDGLEPLGAAALASADGPGLEHLADLTRAASALDVGRPEVAWLFPELEGQRLTRGSAVRVRVTGFTVGSTASADGQVRLTLSGGTGCEGSVLHANKDVSQGRGEVELLLPPGCSGTGVTLVAELEDREGGTLRPAVAATRVVDIP
jgi:hypothetical protein